MVERLVCERSVSPPMATDSSGASVPVPVTVIILCLRLVENLPVVPPSVGMDVFGPLALPRVGSSLPMLCWSTC